MADKITDKTKTADAPGPDGKPFQPSVADCKAHIDATKGNVAAATRACEVSGSLPAVSLSNDVIKIDAGLAKTAVEGGDFAGLKRIMDPMSALDRRHLEQQFPELRDDMRKNLKAVDYTAALSILNREDGKTNLLGNLQTAFQTAKSDSTQGQDLVRATLETLNSSRLLELDQQSKAQTGKGFLQTLLENPDISQENKDLVKQMVLGKQLPAGAAGIEVDGKNYAAKGTDKLTADDVKAMAAIAVKAKDLNMYKDVFGTDLPVTKQALQELSKDEQFKAQFRTAFEDGRSDTDKQIAEDVLSEGKVSLASVVVGNMTGSFFVNQENNDLALTNATPEQRQMFALGRQLSDGNKPASTAAEIDALKYYKKMESAFDTPLQMREDAFSDHRDSNGQLDEGMVNNWKKGFERDKSVLEDQLEYGRKTLVSQLAGLGNRPSDDQLFSTVEKMGRDDFNLLHGSAASRTQFESELKQSLQSYVTPDQLDKVMAMIDAKAGPKAEGSDDKAAKATDKWTFEDSQHVKRSIMDVANQTSGMFHYDYARVTSAVASMSADDAAKYKNNTDGFRDQMDKFLNYQITDQSQKALVQSVLKQVATTGKSPVLDSVDQLRKDAVDGADVPTRVKDVEAILQDKKLHDRLANPATADDKELVKLIQLGSLDNVNFGIGKLWPEMLSTGHVPVLTQIDLGVPMKDLYEAAAVSPQRDFFAARYMTEQEKEILDNVVKQNGKEDLADRVRAFVAGSGGDYKDFYDTFSKLTSAEREQLNNDYQAKYKTSLNDDFLSRVKKADVDTYTNLLRPAGRDLVQDLFGRVQQLDASGNPADGTKLTYELAVRQTEALEAKYETMRKGLVDQGGRDKQIAALDQFYGEAKRQAGESEEKKAEAIYEATLAVAMVASIPATAGLSAGALAALLPAAAASGAAYRMYVMQSVEKGDFDDSTRNITKQLVIGAIDGGLIAAPGVIAELQAYSKAVKAGDATFEFAGTGAGAIKTAAERAPEVLANEPNVAVVATEAERAPAVAAVEPSVTVAATEAERAPVVVAASEPSATVVATDAKLTPVLAPAEPAATIVATDAKLTPVLAPAEPAAPIAATDAKLTPVLAPAEPDATVVATDAKRAPVVVAGEPSVTVVAAGAERAPLVVAADAERAEATGLAGDAAKARKADAIAEEKSVAQGDAVQEQRAIAMKDVAARSNDAVGALTNDAVQERSLMVESDGLAKNAAGDATAAEGRASAARGSAAEVSGQAQQLTSEGRVAEASVAQAKADEFTAKANVEDLKASEAKARETAEQARADEAQSRAASDDAGVKSDQGTVQSETAKADAAAQQAIAAEKDAAALREQIKDGELIVAEKARAAQQAAERLELAASDSLEVARGTGLAAVAGIKGAEAVAALDKSTPPAPTAVDKTLEPSAFMIKAATVRRGEGPFQSAERMLKADGKRHSIDELMDLTNALKVVYGANDQNPSLKGLREHHNFVDKQTYSAIYGQVHDARVKALLEQYAAH